MRDGNGMGSFMLGLGLGAVVGIAVNRWMDKGITEQGNDNRSEFKLDRNEIANIAEQFIHAEPNATKEIN